MKRILITGDSGFIGSYLTPLLKKQHNVLGWSLSRGSDIFEDSFRDAVIWADVVIHLAAIISVPHSFEHPNETFITNTLGTARVLRLCAKYKKKLIYLSTGAVHFPESSPYAHSKYLAEELVKSLIGYIPIVIFRIFNVFGPGSNPDAKSIFHTFATAKEILVNGTGEQDRDFIHIKDLVPIIKASLSPKWDNKIIEVGTGKKYTVRWIAEQFAKHRKMKVTYGPKIKEVWSSKADIRMLKKLYKKPLKTNLEKDIKEMVEYYETAR